MEAPAGLLGAPHGRFGGVRKWAPLVLLHSGRGWFGGVAFAQGLNPSGPAHLSPTPAGHTRASSSGPASCCRPWVGSPSQPSDSTGFRKTGLGG